ncbi:hypothetical protein [Haliangium sp.]|uniref:hypothetical protein n=1 Tax=Haliangium sp. TaxID=2663208 RepID=UPI003D118D25
MTNPSPRLARRLGVAGVCVAAALLPTAAPAWEAETTHAGLSERAALHGHLHGHLRDRLGVAAGVFAELTVPPADAPELIEALRALNPTHCYVPDERGRMRALGWLSAGAVVADIPAAHSANHFFDPTTGAGLSDSTLGGLFVRMRHWIQARSVGAGLVRSGRPATDWLIDAENPMGYEGFLDQYAKAVGAATAGERERHLAGALVAAGALLHVLQDMGSPSHVRDDLGAHYDRIGAGSLDRGSRFERVAALGYGRLGVPGPASNARLSALIPGGAIPAGGLRAFLSNPDRTGLADLTAQRWFSAYTLPAPLRIHAGMGSGEISERLNAGLARPLPAPPRRLDLEAARADGARLEDQTGVCVARYRIDADDRLTWRLDDDCMNEQIAAILPVVVSYSAAMLDWLFRGAIDLTVTSADGAAQASAAAAQVALGSGQLSLFWDDETGMRKPLGAPVTVTAGALGVTLIEAVPVPAQARAVAALFKGVDAGGERIVAVGYRPL